MEHKFKILTTKKEIDLIPYIKDYFNTNPDTEILIGTDSQNKRKNTTYALCCVLYRPGKGGHVLYTRYETPRDPDTRTRLINETWASIELAEYIKSQLGIKATFIDLDLNNDSKYKSNEVLSSAVGLTEAYGYDTRYKNSVNTPLVSYVCDSLCK